MPSWIDKLVGDDELFLGANFVSAMPTKAVILIEDVTYWVLHTLASHLGAWRSAALLDI
jgi:hypothetical protein